MDLNTLLTTIMGIGLTIVGWFARELWAAVQKLKEDLSKLEIKIGTDYVRYDRLKDAMGPIMQALEEIKQTLHTKADKP